jgi:large subunit ribosomal protein L30
MSAKKITITQTGSGNRSPKDQRATLECLGLGRIGKVVNHTAEPSVIGMIKKVSHLVTVVEVK